MTARNDKPTGGAVSAPTLREALERLVGAADRHHVAAHEYDRSLAAEAAGIGDDDILEISGASRDLAAAGKALAKSLAAARAALDAEERPGVQPSWMDELGLCRVVLCRTGETQYAGTEDACRMWVHSRCGGTADESVSGDDRVWEIRCEVDYAAVIAARARISGTRDNGGRGWTPAAPPASEGPQNHDCPVCHQPMQEDEGRGAWSCQACPGPPASEGPDGEFLLLCWVHSHADTGEPLQFDFCRARGDVHLSALEAATSDSAVAEDLAREAAAVGVQLDTWQWCRVALSCEADGDCQLSILEALAAPPASEGPANGVLLIDAERRRQVEAEGYSPEHDDQHTDGSIAIAAACYAVDGGPARVEMSETPDGWPWERAAWKPKDYLRNLIRAGALIAAEIDRVRRLEVRGHVAAPPASEGPEEGLWLCDCGVYHRVGCACPWDASPPTDEVSDAAAAPPPEPERDLRVGSCPGRFAEPEWKDAPPEPPEPVAWAYWQGGGRLAFYDRSEEHLARHEAEDRLVFPLYTWSAPPEPEAGGTEEAQRDRIVRAAINWYERDSAAVAADDELLELAKATKALLDGAE